MPRMTFIDPDGTRHEVEAPVGLSVLEIAHRNNINLEGACEGSLACSTCHVIVDPAWFDKLDEVKEDEEDMLDRARRPVQAGRDGAGAAGPVAIRRPSGALSWCSRPPAGTRPRRPRASPCRRRPAR